MKKFLFIVTLLFSLCMNTQAICLEDVLPINIEKQLNASAAFPDNSASYINITDIKFVGDQSEVWKCPLEDELSYSNPDKSAFSLTLALENNCADFDGQINLKIYKSGENIPVKELTKQLTSKVNDHSELDLTGDLSDLEAGKYSVILTSSRTSGSEETLKAGEPDLDELELEVTDEGYTLSHNSHDNKLLLKIHPVIVKENYSKDLFPEVYCDVTNNSKKTFISSLNASNKEGALQLHIETNGSVQIENIEAEIGAGETTTICFPSQKLDPTEDGQEIRYYVAEQSTKESSDTLTLKKRKISKVGINYVSKPSSTKSNKTLKPYKSATERPTTPKHSRLATRSQQTAKSAVKPANNYVDHKEAKKPAVNKEAKKLVSNKVAKKQVSNKVAKKQVSNKQVKSPAAPKNITKAQASRQESKKQTANQEAKKETGHKEIKEQAGDDKAEEPADNKNVTKQNTQNNESTDAEVGSLETTETIESLKRELDEAKRTNNDSLYDATISRLVDLTDSLNAKNYRDLKEDASLRYNVQEEQSKREEAESRLHLAIISFIVIILLVIAAFILYIYNYKRKAKQNNNADSGSRNVDVPKKAEEKTSNPTNMTVAPAKSRTERVEVPIEETKEEKPVIRPIIAVAEKPTSTVEDQPISKPTNTVEEKPTSTVAEKPTSTVEEKPTNIVEEKQDEGQNDSTPNEEASKAAKDEQIKALYDRVVKIVEEEELYKDPEFAIDYLAKKVFSNRTYLSNAINKYSGMQFRNWLAKYRIEHAKRLLKQDPTIKLNELCTLCGFVSSRSFYRQFHNLEGMTPTEWLHSIGLKDDSKDTAEDAAESNHITF